LSKSSATGGKVFDVKAFEKDLLESDLELAANMIDTKCQYLEGDQDVEDSDIDEEELKYLFV